MKKIGICGHFGGNKKFLDGQTIKTKIITAELKSIYGDDNVITMDTFGGARKIVNHMWKLWQLLVKSENIFILPAHNAVKIFVPYLTMLNKLYKKKLHYIVIGGWLPQLITSKKYLANCLKSFEYIYVETSTMKKQMSKMGYENIKILPNCKNLSVLNSEDLIYSNSIPFRLCIFSRITKNKGICDAIKVISEINKEKEHIVFMLDIYGQIDSEFQEEFEALLKEHSKFIQYKGCVEYDKSTDTLKNYYALLFPTRFYTEGIPGTIIDAYAAGIPVISSRWESFNDVIDDEIVGIGYNFNDINALKNVLIKVYENPLLLNNMKENCLKKAQSFNASIVVRGNINVD